MGRVSAGAQRDVRIAQCHTLKIITSRSLPMRTDGEPWMQGCCEISISHHNSMRMLRRVSDQRL